MKINRSYFSLLDKYKWTLIFVAVFFTANCHATDIIANNISDVKDTVTGSGKYFILLAEVILSGVIFAKTKNYLALGGVVILSMYFNMAMSLIG